LPTFIGTPLYSSPNLPFMKKSPLLLSATTVCLLILVFILSTGCKKNITDPGSPPPTNPPPPTNIDDVTVNASIRGIVVDNNNLPVFGATVTSGSQTTTTDQLGQFYFKNITLSKHNGYVKVSKTGYFQGSRSFFTTAGRTHMVRIMMIPKTTAGTFPAASGGTINLTGGAKLVMPADAITDASGTPYTGSVDVAMTWIDPTSTTLPYIIPGDLRGITTSGEERGLQTFGMLGVELTGGAQPLKLAANKTAELTFPIPASLAASAPATIDLWHFDEATARWRQEGTATKNGSYYIANVKHFSFWNCDVPFPLVEICMSIVSSDAVPLNNVQVRIKRADGTYACVRTDSAGNLCGKVPKNETLVLEVLSQCNTVMASQNIGPFNSNTNIGTITTNVPAGAQLVITGTVKNCSGGNVMRGNVVVYVTGGHTYSAEVANGTFSVTIFNCGAQVQYSLVPADHETLQLGIPITGSGTFGIVNAGVLKACGTTVQFYVQTVVDGIPETYIQPPAIILNADDHPPIAPWLYYTRVQGYNPSVNGSGGHGMYVWFKHNGTPGIHPITGCAIHRGGNTPIGDGAQIMTPNPMVTITELGPPHLGTVEGSYALQIRFGNGITRNVTSTFRVNRQ
jgi:hypothetical protein